MKEFDNLINKHFINACLQLDKSLFPNLTWESDPIEVEITIKRKKNE